MKTHLKDSDVPLVEGSAIKAACETEIKDAVFVAQSDDGATAESVVNSCSCYRCKKNRESLTEKYLYLLTNGANLRRGGEVEA